MSLFRALEALGDFGLRRLVTPLGLAVPLGTATPLSPIRGFRRLPDLSVAVECRLSLLAVLLAGDGGSTGDGAGVGRHIIDSLDQFGALRGLARAMLVGR